MDPEAEPLLSEASVDRLRAAVWLACAAAYIAVLAAGVAAGASDLFAMGRALGASLALALLGRALLGLLAQAHRPASGWLDAAPRPASLIELLPPAEAETRPPDPAPLKPGPEPPRRLDRPAARSAER